MNPATRLRRIVTGRLPLYASAAIARRLVARADAARDAGRHPLAAALYEESLHFSPGRGAVHVQCGHMLKEAGDFAGAERHYEAARRLMPEDDDLALQLGHFYKLSGRPDRAEEAYRRALTLRPGWVEAANELADIQGTIEGGAPADVPGDLAWAVPELLPRARGAPDRRLDRIEVRRLAPRWMRSEWGMMKVLRGVEAIRGFCIAAVALDEVEILLDGATIRRAPLQAFAVDGEAAAYRKYVFNVWHDFGAVAPGRYRIELRIADARGHLRVHRGHVLIAPPTGEHPESDALVLAEPGDPRSLEQQIGARPSMVRPAARTPLPAPVRTILVQRIDQLGDLVCSVPAVRRLRALFPGATLIGLLSPANAPLGRTLGLFDDIVVTEFPMDRAERRRVMPLDVQDRLRRTLARYDIDIAIDLCESSESRPALLLSGARFLYGFKPREWPWLSAGLELISRDPINTLEMSPPSRRILALVEALGAIHVGGAQALRRPELGREALARYGIAPDARHVVLHAGTRLGFNRWEGFGALAALLLERTDLTVMLLTDEGGEAPDLPPSERLHVLGGALPFDDFDALLSYCAAFVGNDSGPKHLASLRGVPVISLHTARTNWSEWGQEITGTIISRRVPCAGCGIVAAEECGKDFTCLRAIRVEEVFAALVSAL